MPSLDLSSTLCLQLLIGEFRSGYKNCSSTKKSCSPLHTRVGASLAATKMLHQDLFHVNSSSTCCRAPYSLLSDLTIFWRPSTFCLSAPLSRPDSPRTAARSATAI